MVLTEFKKDLIQMIEKMPDDISISDVMDELYLRLEINKAEEEIKAGKSISHDKVEKKVEKWLAR
ncbi:MAG: hypothetical protein OEZ13_13320 [Spirochaetia bacterium]|nr:hypothetical protein [Spirochaetia bacterium]